MNINIQSKIFQEYPNKSRCFECGQLGHLSYKCEKNLLGERDPPPKKIRKRKKQNPAEKGLSKVIVNKVYMSFVFYIVLCLLGNERLPQ